MGLGEEFAGETQGQVLGRSLRTRRKELNLTMQTVADAVGLSVGFISQVERGLTAPSLTSLTELARILDLPLGHFLDRASRSPERIATRRGERPQFSIAASGVSYERLSARFPGSTLTSVVVHEPPGPRREPTTHAGEELIYIVAGAMTAIVEEETTVLMAGDSIHFDSRRPHTAWNHTDQTATILWCGTVDVFGEDGPDPIHRVRPDSNGLDRTGADGAGMGSNGVGE